MDRQFAEEYRNLGKNIAYYRNKESLTQEGLAIKANVSRGYLSQIEAENVHKAPSLDMIFNIAKTLKIPAYQLFMDENTKK